MESNSLTQRKNLLRWARTRAAKDGTPFKLSIDDFEIPSRCPVLDIPIRCGKAVSTDNSPTLDKIIPEIGYVSGNVVVISNRANRLKSNASWLELRKLTQFFEDLIISHWMQ